MELRVAYFQPQGTGKSDLDQIEPASHHRMIHLCLPEIGHSPGAIRFVTDYRRRLFVLGPHNFSAPYG